MEMEKATDGPSGPSFAYERRSTKPIGDLLGLFFAEIGHKCFRPFKNLSIFLTYDYTIRNWDRVRDLGSR